MGKRKHDHYVASVALASLGGILISAAILLASCNHYSLRYARLSEGTVTSFRTNYNAKNESRVPQISFFAPDGVPKSVEPIYFPLGYEIGQKVTVAYDESSGKAKILTFGQQFGMAALMTTLGMALLFIATILAVGRTLVPKIYLPSTPKNAIPAVPDPGNPV